jgi:two-component system, chemotaxis family, response regulator WspF
MKIAIVNDMALARETLRRIVSKAPEHEVAWLASDGSEAVAKTKESAPDLILMDLIMPNMDGVEATKRIMSTNPCPILIVTGSVTGNIGRVYEAMGWGALDAIDTPAQGSDPGGSSSRVFLEKLDRLERMTKGLRPAGAKSDVSGDTVVWASNPKPPAGKLVVIGASTGGPKALVEILCELPANFSTPIIIVQHVDPAFANGFVQWLGSQSPLPVEMAAPGSEPKPGQIMIARTGDHLIMSYDRLLRYTSVSVESFYKPSVDAFFLSVAQNWGGPGVGILLTGMGRDGAVGLKALRKSGWLTIAQDQASSAVWGMPKAAIELGGANQILSPRQIGQALVGACR